MSVRCLVSGVLCLFALVLLPAGAGAESVSKQSAHAIPQLGQVAAPANATLAKPDPELSLLLKSHEALFQQIRESSASLKAFYARQWLSGDRLGQRALIETLADPAHVPKADEVARLFTSLQQQLDAMGRIESARQQVHLPNGSRVERDVLNLGGFSLIGDGRYLVYQPEHDTLAELARQPPTDLLTQARQFSMEDDGASIRPIALDPSGGVTLQLVVQVPRLLERIRQGGPVGYVILVLAGFAFPLAAYRFWMLRKLERNIRWQIESLEIRTDNPLGRILKDLNETGSPDTEVLNITLDQALLIEQEALEQALPLLRLLAAVAPMLGLLGTVTGMIATFQAIALHGSGDPKLMSGGISEALVTTVEGLVVAIPILLLHSLLITRSSRIGTLLATQGAVAVARRLAGQVRCHPL